MASETTTGVYIFANFVINTSVFDFFSLEFLTNSIILLIPVSSNFLVTFISIKLLSFINPAKTSSFILAFFGIDSPS